MFYVDILPGMTGFQIAFSYFNMVRSMSAFDTFSHLPFLQAMLLVMIFFVTLPTAMLVVLLFEMPLVHIEKLVFGKLFGIGDKRK